MSKPNWKNAPSWAQCLAQDPDGAWYWFEKVPVIDCDEWYEPSPDGKIRRADIEAEEWAMTLEFRK